jgi:gamma-glutamylcyclotransferase (GGCT)/AIG2-like uncharacterized protein YtfP
MQSLDDFEGPEYRRVMTQARCADDHRSPQAAWVWEWLGPCDENQRILSGDWLVQR